MQRIKDEGAYNKSLLQTERFWQKKHFDGFFVGKIQTGSFKEVWFSKRTREKKKLWTFSHVQHINVLLEVFNTVISDKD